jgi:hypothetical protein
MKKEDACGLNEIDLSAIQIAVGRAADVFVLRWNRKLSSESFLPLWG